MRIGKDGLPCNHSIVELIESTQDNEYRPKRAASFYRCEECGFEMRPPPVEPRYTLAPVSKEQLLRGFLHDPNRMSGYVRRRGNEMCLVDDRGRTILSAEILSLRAPMSIKDWAHLKFALAADVPHESSQVNEIVTTLHALVCECFCVGCERWLPEEAAMCSDCWLMTKTIVGSLNIS